MSVEVSMPQMGESVVEGTVTKWLVKVGESVSEDQPLCEISTDKVDTEIPSPGAGIISKLVAEEGQTLPVGSLLAVIDSPGTADGQAKPAAVAAAPAKTPESPTKMPAPSAPSSAKTAPSSASTAASVQAAPPARPAAAPSAAAGSKPAENGPPRRYSPVVLRMAEERGIDLNLVPGTGIGGRISKRDVEHYLEALHRGPVPAPTSDEGTVVPGPTAAPVSRPATAGAPSTSQEIPPSATIGAGYRPPVYQPREGDTVEPFTRRRKLIAEHMVYSKTHAPHVGTVAELDLTKVTMLREAHKDAFHKREGFTLTLLPFAAMATIRALKEFPRMNASVAGDSVVIRREINLGIAMDAEEGLVVPVIKQAETLSVMGLAREIERLHRKVVDKSLVPDDLAGGSFTLSNPGREGNLYGFAIINQPQVGILRMGEVKKRPVVIEIEGADAIAVRTMMYLALSYDHRVIDGVLGNRFLYRTARILEEADFEL